MQMQMQMENAMEHQDDIKRRLAALKRVLKKQQYLLRLPQNRNVAAPFHASGLSRNSGRLSADTDTDRDIPASRIK
jgi:hypothetical protein